MTSKSLATSSTKFDEFTVNQLIRKILKKILQKQDVDYLLSKIVWESVFVMFYIHLVAFYGMYLIAFQAKLSTTLWYLAVAHAGILGITAGAHRLWCHKSCTAKWPMRLLLMIFQTVAHQGSIYKWARDHRLHHKHIDTDADPYNVTRGFFFSHVGWLLVRKHPEVIRTGATTDCSDLMQDPIVVFQNKWFKILMPLFCFIFPMLVPYWAFGESLWNAWHINICRYCLSLNVVFAVNSVAHRWGAKPYDKSIGPANNALISFLTNGEGWHNYHHVFPWDYKGEEFGNYGLNITTAFIDFFAFLGLAYDLKTAKPDIIKKRRNKVNLK